MIHDFFPYNIKTWCKTHDHTINPLAAKDMMLTPTVTELTSNFLKDQSVIMNPLATTKNNERSIIGVLNIFSILR